MSLDGQDGFDQLRFAIMRCDAHGLRSPHGTGPSWEIRASADFRRAIITAVNKMYAEAEIEADDPKAAVFFRGIPVVLCEKATAPFLLVPPWRRETVEVAS